MSMLLLLYTWHHLLQMLWGLHIGQVIRVIIIDTYQLGIHDNLALQTWTSSCTCIYTTSLCDIWQRISPPGYYLMLFSWHFLASCVKGVTLLSHMTWSLLILDLAHLCSSHEGSFTYYFILHSTICYMSHHIIIWPSSCHISRGILYLTTLSFS